MSERDVERNRAHWTEINRAFTDADAAKSWSDKEITWGVFSIPEQQLGVLGDVRGLDVIELGCGTAYFSSWLARRGARAVGIDPTPAQLASARRCQQQFGLSFSLYEASAERVPLPDASFDLAFSEYGACLWCEPKLWVKEAARLLRPNGRLIFLTSTVLVNLCYPDDANAYAGTELLRPLAAIRRVESPQGGVEFCPSHSEWIAILRTNGFDIERLCELYPPATAKEHDYYKLANLDWARKWPMEELWVARKA